MGELHSRVNTTEHGMSELEEIPLLKHDEIKV